MVKSRITPLVDLRPLQGIYPHVHRRDEPEFPGFAPASFRPLLAQPIYSCLRRIVPNHDSLHERFCALRRIKPALGLVPAQAANGRTDTQRGAASLPLRSALSVSTLSANRSLRSLPRAVWVYFAPGTPLSFHLQGVVPSRDWNPSPGSCLPCCSRPASGRTCSFEGLYPLESCGRRTEVRSAHALLAFPHGGTPFRRRSIGFPTPPLTRLCLSAAYTTFEHGTTESYRAANRFRQAARKALLRYRPLGVCHLVAESLERRLHRLKRLHFVARASLHRGFPLLRRRATVPEVGVAFRRPA
jgi:hypothetical protein